MNQPSTFAVCRTPGQRASRAMRLAAAFLAWGALPYFWLQTVGRWLQYGPESGLKWPAATLGLWLLLVILSARRRGEALVENRRAASAAALGLCWCTVQAIAFWIWASPLHRAADVAILFAIGTLWVLWSWAGLTTSKMRLLASAATLGGLLLLAATAVACLEARGLDGGGRPILGCRFWPAGATEAIASPISESDIPRETDRNHDEPSFPCFRGAEGLGVADARLVGDWSATAPRTVWRRPVATGWSGFAIDAAQAFTLGQLGDKEIIVCYDLATGREQWSHADRAKFTSASAGDGPRATPAVAGDWVYSLGAAGLLNCLDRRSGRRRWSVDVLADNESGNLMHGLSGSPLVVDDLIVVSAGGKAGKSLVAYDRMTGRRAWRAGDDPAGYGSPMVCTLAGRRQIVILNRPGLAAHDIETGRVLWTFPWTNSTETNCSQPVPVGVNRLFVSSGYGKGCALLQVELRKNGEWAVRPVWTSRSLKTKFASAVLHAGHAYGLDDGILCCVDLADGQRRWKAGRYGHGQVLLAGDKLLVQCESGEVALVAADPAEYRELGRFAALAGKTWNYPALAGRWLLCRNDREAACFELNSVK